MRYAGFGLRLVANLVDTIVTGPLLVLSWPGLLSRSASIALAVPVFAAALGYNVGMHARWGQTIGKMAARIKVVTVGGASIAWREALLRDSVGIGFGIIATVASVDTFLRIPASSWSDNWVQQAKLIGDARPMWGRAAHTCLTIWFWSELVVLLFNPKKRALHDFIAGTVVIRKL
jgi:uncharacterized RDD family membrane protein YckC